MYIVYGLEDQRNNETFYVGTTSDVQARFTQHLGCDGSNPLKDARIQEMRAAGYLPLMRTLQVVPNGEQAKLRESYWMRHYYEVGMPLVNQVIPIVQGNIIVVREETKSEKHKGPKLKAAMTLDEQREYVLHLLNQGLLRRKIITKVDGYIHVDTVNSVIDENIVRLPAVEPVEAVVLENDLPVPVSYRETPVEPVPLRPRAQFVAKGEDKIVPDEKQDDLAYFYAKHHDVKEALREIGLGNRYFNHASWVLEDRGLKVRRA